MEDSFTYKSMEELLQEVENKSTSKDSKPINPYLRSLIIVVKGVDSYISIEKNFINSEMFPNIPMNKGFQKQYYSLKDKHYNEFLKDLEVIPSSEFTSVTTQSIFNGDPLIQLSLETLLQYFLDLEEYEKCAKIQIYLNNLKKA